jgi:ribosome-binding factor A
MADNLTFQYIVELIKKGDFSSAASEFDKLQKGAEKAGGAMEKMKAGAEKLLAFFGAELVLKEAFNEFLEGEKAVSKLDAALRSSGQTTAEYRKEVDGLIEKFKELTTFSGTEITNMVAKLVALGAPKEALGQISEAVLDLSTLMDKDLNRATQAMGRAIKGEFSAFTELGFKFDDAANTGQKLTSVLDQIAKVAGGQAKAAAESLGGTMEQTRKQIAEFQEQVGKLVAQSLGALSNAFQKLQKVADWQSEMQQIGQLQDSYNKLAEALQRVIVARQKAGTLSTSDALDMASTLADIRKVLNSPQAQGDSLSMASRDNAINKVLPSVRNALDELDKRVSGQGFGSATQGGAGTEKPGLVIDNVQERKAALQELSKLQDLMYTESLNGLDKERAQAADNYNERAALIIKDTNLGRLSAQQKEQLENENQETLKRNLEEISRKQQEELDKRGIAQMQAARKVAEAEDDMRNQAASLKLKGQELEMFQLEVNHEKRMRQLRELEFEDDNRYAELMAMEEQLHQAEQQRVEASHSFSEGLKQDMEGVAEAGKQAFASGLATAMVDAFEGGDKAFQKFASNFLRMIAQMILQALILRAINSVIGGLAGGGQVMAARGVQMAAGGVDGVSEVSNSTFFPKFNVVAGEAGREVLTVLSRPRSMNVAGIAAQVGNVGRRQLAIVDYNDLAKMGGARRMADGGSSSGGGWSGSGGGGVGGRVQIHLSLEPGLRADWVNEASNVSVDKVTREMGTHSVLSETTKRLVS